MCTATNTSKLSTVIATDTTTLAPDYLEHPDINRLKFITRQYPTNRVNSFNPDDYKDLDLSSMDDSSHGDD